ncbi:MAG: beta-lactamase family protein [Oscillospiraceae bacterium]|nr:beta-lactamase family protein [Oscillospiraceae bacterium]
MKRLLIMLAICPLCLLGAMIAIAIEAPRPTLSTSESAAASSDIVRVSAAASPAYPTSGKLYGIGSVSKVFTAAAVMKLVEEGKLDLDEPLTTYIPDFFMADARYAHITPRMLLNHSSGLMGMTANNSFLLGDNDTFLHDNFLEFLKTQTLKHDPGDRSIYSNDSFTLAEILVERVSGATFTDFIARYFAEPLGLEYIKTPQSDFDRGMLACTYLGSSELKPQSLGVIGAGAMYATMEDLCRFATIFMDGSDGSVLNKSSVGEMSKSQHKMAIVPPGSDTVFRYGLGWDCVESYPFNQMGIRALSKGGSTMGYFTNLTVLPEYNLAAAVAASGAGGLETLVAQEIILAVLEEEGLIPKDTAITTPRQNLNRAKVPESVKSSAGVYAAGSWGQFSVVFTEDSLLLTPIGIRNERPMEFIYNTDGEFISTNGDFIGVFSSEPGAVGITALTFDGDFLMLQSYESVPGLSNTANAMPFAQKITPNPISNSTWKAWLERNGKEYLLVSEKFTSALYINMPVAKTLTDERVYGYVAQGVYTAGGFSFPAAKIEDERFASGFQNTPTMTGRDTVDLYVELTNGVEYLHMNNFRYIDSTAAAPFSALGETVIIGAEPFWAQIDSGSSGKTVSVATPENGSWFVYDEKMNCIATSLEKNLRSTLILPENGRIVFAGAAGAEFTLH